MVGHRFFGALNALLDFTNTGEILVELLRVTGSESAGAAAVLAYRVILFWLPLLVGAIAFVLLRRALARATRPDLCQPIPAA